MRVQSCATPATLSSITFPVGAVPSGDHACGAIELMDLAIFLVQNDQIIVDTFDRQIGPWSGFSVSLRSFHMTLYLIDSIQKMITYAIMP